MEAHLKSYFTLTTIATILALSPALLAQDFETAKLANWHQWRGPTANGVSREADPPLTWDEQTNVKWKATIPGEGSSTPIIWDENVFVLSAIVTDRKPVTATVPSEGAIPKPPSTIVEFVVWNLDRATGNVKWKKIVNEDAPHEGRHQSTTYAAASPMTDGNYLYASFGSYGVYCLTFEGEIVWQRDLGNMRTRRGWGEAVSPVAHDGHLVVNWDQEDQSKIFVLDSATGEIKWEDDRDEPTTWATPLVVEHQGTTQLITNGTNKLRSYNLETGELVWQSRGTTLNAIPSPVPDGSNVICMAGYRGNSAISISLDSTGQANLEQLNWQFNRDTPYVPSPVLVDGRIFFTKANQAILNCLDAKTGEPIYELTRLPNLKNMYASPVATKDRIYFVSREGVTLVIENGPEFKVLATNKIVEGIDASPAISGNQLFLRSKTSLYCIEESTVVE